MNQAHQPPAIDPPIPHGSREALEAQIMEFAKTMETSSSALLGLKVALSSLPPCPHESIPLLAHPESSPCLLFLKSVMAHVSLFTTKRQKFDAELHGMRNVIVEDILEHMMMRELAYMLLLQPDPMGDLRTTSMGVLVNGYHFIVQETELALVEKAFVDYNAVIKRAAAACIELEKLRMSFMATHHIPADWDSVGESTDIEELPHLRRLFLSTVGPGASSVNSDDATDGASQIHPQLQQNPVEKAEFALFMKLPIEIRFLIWRAALPGPRILTSNSHHNSQLSMLHVCRESRWVAESHFYRVYSPTSTFPHQHTQLIFTNTNTDIVIRDLTIRDNAARDLFNLPDIPLAELCHKMLIGVSQVKNVALAYDILRRNGQALFRSIGVCCPKLENLIVFPSTQIPRSAEELSQELKFVELDSNLWDYTYFRWSAIPLRQTRRDAGEGLALIGTLYELSLRFKLSFRKFVKTLALKWQPRISVCLLARRDPGANGWQSGSLAGLGDSHREGFWGDDGCLYEGFVESMFICGEDGEELSRYDGMEMLFREE